MLKKIIGILLTMILIVSLLPLSAFAGGENGLVYHLTTDKSKYSKTEDITVTLIVTNKSSDGVSYAGVKLVNKVPAGYTLKKGSSLEISVSEACGLRRGSRLQRQQTRESMVIISE